MLLGHDEGKEKKKKKKKKKKKVGVRGGKICKGRNSFSDKQNVDTEGKKKT
jgi:hypothetical protein